MPSSSTTGSQGQDFAKEAREPAMDEARDPGPMVGMVAVQLELDIDDFASEARYAARLMRAAEDAVAEIQDLEHRLLVFPENAGHFVPLCHAPALARRQASVQRAMAVFAATNPLSLVRTMWRERVLDPEIGLMLTVMPRAEKLVREVFARIARRCRAYVVAGSHLAAQGGQVSNTSYTFDPRGALVATTDKVNLVVGMEDDSPGGAKLAHGRAEALPIVRTPFGELATLICYDGFEIPHTDHEPRFVFMGEVARRKGAQIVANPSANPWPWNERWIHAKPGDTALRREQWRREGLAASMGAMEPGVRYGITAHMCARILDFHFHGRSEILERTDQGVRVLASARTDDRGEAVVARVPASTLTHAAAAPVRAFGG